MWFVLGDQSRGWATWHFLFVKIPWYSTRALKGQGVNHYLKQFKFSHGSLEYYSCGYKIIRELMRDEEIIERGSSVGDYDDSLTDPYAETMLRHDEYSDRPFVVDREFVVLGK